MIIEGIQLTGEEHILLPSIPLVRDCKINSQSLLRIKTMREKMDGTEWLDESTRMVVSEMDNDTKRLIRETELELSKAKSLMKEKFPKQYKKEFWKVIIKNPFKSILAWLLK